MGIADVYRAVMRVAAGRCQCTGQCGDSHATQDRGRFRDRCDLVPVRIASADPRMKLIVAVASTAFLVALCDACDAGRKAGVR